MDTVIQATKASYIEMRVSLTPVHDTSAAETMYWALTEYRQSVTKNMIDGLGRGYMFDEPHQRWNLAHLQHCDELMHALVTDQLSV